jgi:hypothetical protein
MVVALEALVVVAVFAAIAVGLVKLAKRVRRRGIGDVVFGVADEIWHPAGHDTRVEVRVQEERVTPAPLPSDD